METGLDKKRGFAVFIISLVVFFSFIWTAYVTFSPQFSPGDMVVESKLIDFGTVFLTAFFMVIAIGLIMQKVAPRVEDVR